MERDMAEDEVRAGGGGADLPLIAALSWSFATRERGVDGVAWSASERWRGWAMSQPKSWPDLLDGVEAFKWPGNVELLASPRHAGKGSERGEPVNLSLDPSYQLLEIMVGNPGPMSGWIHRDKERQRAWSELEGAFEGLERLFERCGCELILRAPTRASEGDEALRVAGAADARAWRAAREAEELRGWVQAGSPRRRGGEGEAERGRL